MGRSRSRTCAWTCSSSIATGFVFSGHKVFGPTGIGALYGKGPPQFNSPMAGGGNMIQNVTFEEDGIPRGARAFRGGDGKHRGCGGTRCCARVRGTHRYRQHQPLRARTDGLRNAWPQLFPDCGSLVPPRIRQGCCPFSFRFTRRSR